MTFPTFLTYILALQALFWVPGPSMAFVLAHAVTHGPRGGVAAALGIGAGDLLLTGASATGLIALFLAWPPGFDVLRLGGAAYMLWLAWGMLRRPGPPAPGAAATTAESVDAATTASARGIFTRALANCLLNPKALLFFMLFLPQFVEPTQGHVTRQVLLLGVVLTINALLGNLLLTYGGARFGAWFRRHPSASLRGQRGLALVFAGLACHLLAAAR
jgi:threonine/homoserine/homoserine lactone efflux protein